MSSLDKSTTELVNPPKAQTRMVKIKATYPIRIMNGKDEHIIQPGTTAEVSEEEAKEFCDKKIDIGYKDTFGNSDPSLVHRKSAIRAVRVK